MTEEEVLMAFAVEPVNDPATLERYLRKYPEHSEALVDCFLELVGYAVRVGNIQQQ